jgi:hypothetical protein
MILIMIAAVGMTHPAVYASDDMRRAGDTQGLLKFVSTTTTAMPSNTSSSLGGDGADVTSNNTNTTSTQIPESARGLAIPERVI